MAWNWHEWIPLSVLSTVEVFSSTILHIFTLGDPTTFFGVKRSKKDAHVHQKGTRLNGKRDVPRSETMGLRAPRFQILAPEGPLARGPEAQCQRTSGKKVPRPRAPRFWWLARGAPRGHRAEFRAPGTFLKKIPLAIYLNGFGLAVSWTRFARVGSSLNWNICLEGTPSAGRKSLGTVRPCLGVKRSKKGAHVHQTVTRLNEKRDVPRTETKGRTASKLGMRRRRGPLIRAPEFEGRGGFLSILCPAARLAKIRPVSGSLLLNSMADKETYEKLGKILFGVPGPGPFGTSLRGSWRNSVCDLGPLGTSEKSPTFRLFEWVRPSGFVDAARKGPIEPNSKSLSQGDPLDRAEKSGDPTTFFRGQEVRKVASTCPFFPWIFLLYFF